MANETEQNTQQNAQTGNSQVKHIKGYRKKGLVNEKVLLERLSDMSIEDNILNPVITLSSVEDDGNDTPSPMEEEQGKSLKGSLKVSLSLDVPSVNVTNEAKRPPIEN